MGKPTLCVDFDGVLHAYTSGWQGVGAIADEPVPGAIEWLRAALEHFDVAIYSSRSKDPKGVEAMRLWLTMWAFELYGHGDIDWLEEISYPTEKPGAFLTIDDRAICFDGDFSVLDPEKLLQFQPWNRGGESDRQRAERLEAECQRMRSIIAGDHSLYGDPATPPPESEPEVATTFIGTLLVGDPFDERDGPWMDRKAWKRMNDLPAGTHIYASSEPLDAPHAPEQAHGDALAALLTTKEERRKYRTRIMSDGSMPGVARLAHDVDALLQALTASGVPEGWKWQTSRDVTDEYVTSLIAPDGTTVYVGEDDKEIAWLERLLSANSGVPHVPEEVRRLPEKWRGYADEYERLWKQSGGLHGSTMKAFVCRELADELEAALATAPADGYKLVPVEPTQDMIERGTSCYGSNNNPRMIYKAMIESAPTDGRE